MVQYNNIKISDYDNFVNELYKICIQYITEFKIERNDSNTYNIYIKDLKTISHDYLIQDIEYLLTIFM